jgi:hypothetical protein
MELEQGRAHDVSHCKVGITSVYEAGGAKLVSLSVMEVATRRETPHRAQVGDTIPIGSDRYKVTAITMPAGAKKGSVTLQKA